ncbi:DNA primase family protein [Tumebacillus flagellatus]|uniref:DNA primase family protein n=1 Tax=Tumebacillus flagellatus TaxID=1157490 RepID=UPI0009E0AD99|nr:phage/plasmid primase, P4 family [Tumebacillus flagellatus]
MNTSKRESNEVIQWIMTTCRLSDEQQVNPDDGILNVANGLLNWKTGQLSAHTPDRLSTIQLPVHYDSKATNETVMNFIQSVVPNDTVDTIFEMIGYCLTTHSRYEKALLLIGSGGNGKSTFINMLSGLCGFSNISSVSLHSLESNRFMMAQLRDKLVNTFSDLPRNQLPNSRNFKGIVSGDLMTAEDKGKPHFSSDPTPNWFLARMSFQGVRIQRRGFIVVGSSSHLRKSSSLVNQM